MAAAVEPLPAIGPRVKALREAMDLSLRDLSERSGVSAPMLSQVERGETSPTLQVAAPSRDGFGMHGSSMFIINPPWTLEKTLRETLPVVSALLAQGDGARFTVDGAST